MADPSELAAMQPPAKISSAEDVTATSNAVVKVLDHMKYTFRDGEPDKMTPQQLESVISVHEKVAPEFGEILRAAYNTMKAMDTGINADTRKSDPERAREYDRGIIGAFNIASDAIFDMAQKQELALSNRVSSPAQNSAPPAVDLGKQLRPELARGAALMLKSIETTYLKGGPPGVKLTDAQIQSTIDTYKSIAPDLAGILSTAWKEMKDAAGRGSTQQSNRAVEDAYKNATKYLQAVTGVVPIASLGGPGDGAVAGLYDGFTVRQSPLSPQFTALAVGAGNAYVAGPQPATPDIDLPKLEETAAVVPRTTLGPKFG